MKAARLLTTVPFKGAIVLAFLAALVAGQAAAGEGRIYRTVDEHGNVVFTDIPPREDDDDAEQIIVETPNSFAPEEAMPANQGQWIVEPDEEEEVAPFSYDALEIVSPPNDEAVRENAGNVTIVGNISPGLRIGHRVRLLMDGTVAQEGTQTSFSLSNVDRGTHTIALEIVDDAGVVLSRSPDSTFHMLRYHIRPSN